MKYEEKSDPANFDRFKKLTRNLLSVSNEAVKEKLAEEQRKKKRHSPHKKK